MVKQARQSHMTPPRDSGHGGMCKQVQLKATFKFHQHTAVQGKEIALQSLCVPGGWWLGGGGGGGGEGGLGQPGHICLPLFLCFCGYV